MRIVKQGEKCLHEVTFAGRGDISVGGMQDGCKVKCPPRMRTLVWWRGHLVMLDGCEVRFEKSSCVHLT